MNIEINFKSICLLLFICLFSQCNSPSRQIEQAFETVDQSLEKTNAVIDQSINDNYTFINLRRDQDRELALRADSIYYYQKKVHQFIDSLKLVLQERDSSGEQLNIAADLMVSGGTEQKLSFFFMQVSEIAMNVKDPASKQKLESLQVSFKQISKDKNWYKQYFEDVPTIAAITMLGKFQNDFSNAAVILLEDIRKQIH